MTSIIADYKPLTADYGQARYMFLSIFTRINDGNANYKHPPKASIKQQQVLLSIKSLSGLLPPIIDKIRLQPNEYYFILKKPIFTL